MTIDEAKVLLCQMYLPQFDEEEKQALTMAIHALEEIKEYKLKEFQCHLAREEGINIGYNKAIDGFAHNLKETLNQEFPMNYASTRPYFTLENARLIVDDVAEQLKAGDEDE